MNDSNCLTGMLSVKYHAYIFSLTSFSNKKPGYIHVQTMEWNNHSETYDGYM
jgi:hypothetical protein